MAARPTFDPLEDFLHKTLTTIEGQPNYHSLKEVYNKSGQIYDRFPAH